MLPTIPDYIQVRISAAASELSEFRETHPHDVEASLDELDRLATKHEVESYEAQVAVQCAALERQLRGQMI